MPGLIDQKPKTAPAKPVPAVMKAGAMAPKVIMEQMNVTPQQKPMLERMVAAGMRLMFDKRTHGMMLEQMQGDGPIEQKLGQGIVGALGVLWQESKGSLPPQLLIPTGMVLLAHAAEFANKTGESVTPEQFGAAQQIMIDTLLQQAGANPEAIASKVPDQTAPAGAQPQGVA